MGAATAVIASTEATIELLRDPAAQRRVAEATAEIERGEWLDEEAVRAMVAATRPSPPSG